MNEVNPSRRYSSPLREQQAAATRLAVLDAARALFVERGYGATTIEQVAATAGVSKPTVFTAVGNKQALLRAVRDVAIAGDDDQVPITGRPAAAAIRDEPDQGRAIGLLAEHLTDVANRYAPIHQVLRGAAESGEEGLRELWDTEEQQRLVGARHWVDVLAGKGALRPDRDRDMLIDLLWLLMAPDNYSRLVHGRGWTRARYQRWLAEEITGLCWAAPQGSPPGSSVRRSSPSPARQAAPGSR